MRPGKLARALALGPLLFTGCLSEPSANAPAANSSAAANANRATVEASPTPEVASGLAALRAGKLENYVSAAAGLLMPEQRKALGRVDGDARRILALRGYLRAGDGAASRCAWSRERIESYEKSPEYAAALAVPGLSPHGQSRAFDFQVMRGSQLIAGPSGAGAWDSEGWTEKVRAAVTRASTTFKGPLASPREPWHYDYQP